MSKLNSDFIKALYDDPLWHANDALLSDIARNNRKEDIEWLKKRLDICRSYVVRMHDEACAVPAGDPAGREALAKAAVPLEVLLMTCCGEYDTTLSPELKVAVREAVDAIRAALSARAVPAATPPEGHCIVSIEEYEWLRAQVASSPTPAITKEMKGHLNQMSKLWEQCKASNMWSMDFCVTHNRKIIYCANFLLQRMLLVRAAVNTDSPDVVTKEPPDSWLGKDPYPIGKDITMSATHAASGVSEARVKELETALERLIDACETWAHTGHSWPPLIEARAALQGGPR